MKIRRKILQDIILIAILAIGISVPILVVEHYQDIHPEGNIGIAVNVRDYPSLYILNASGEPVKNEYLKQSNTHTVCHWKGTASYYSLDVDGKSNQDAAWYYPDPSPLAEGIKGRIAFWK